MNFIQSSVSALLVGCTIYSQAAFSHISITNKLYANNYSQIELAVPHGCEGTDTVKVELTLPAGLTGVRPINSHFGEATITKDEEGNVTTLTWTADKDTPYESDSHAYSLAFRTKTPDTPFATLHFPTVQFCEGSDGMTYTSEWVGMGGHDPDSDESASA